MAQNKRQTERRNLSWIVKQSPAAPNSRPWLRHRNLAAKGGNDNTPVVVMPVLFKLSLRPSLEFLTSLESLTSGCPSPGPVARIYVIITHVERNTRHGLYLSK